jgi:hypothetical protein
MKNTNFGWRPRVAVPFNTMSLVGQYSASLLLAVVVGQRWPAEARSGKGTDDIASRSRVSDTYGEHNADGER